MAASRTRGPSAALPALRTHRNDTLPLSRSEAGQPSPGQGTPEAATTTAAWVTSLRAKAAGRLSDRQPTCHRSSEGDHQGHVTLITGQHPCDGRSHCTL